MYRNAAECNVGDLQQLNLRLCTEYKIKER